MAKRSFELSFNATSSGVGESLYERRRAKAKRSEDSEAADFIQDILDADFGDIMTDLPCFDVLTDMQVDGAASSSTASTRSSAQPATTITTPLTELGDDCIHSLPTDSPQETAILLHNWRSAPALASSGCARTKALIVHVRKTRTMAVASRSKPECDAISAFVASTALRSLPWARDYAVARLEDTLNTVSTSATSNAVSPSVKIIILITALKAAVNIRNESLIEKLTHQLVLALAANWHSESTLFSKNASALRSLSPFLHSYNLYTAIVPTCLQPSTSYPHQLSLPLTRILQSWRAFHTAGSIPSQIIEILTHLCCLRSLSSSVATRQLDEAEARELLALHWTLCHRLDIGMEVETRPHVRCVLAALRVIHHLILIGHVDIMVAMRLTDLAYEIRIAEPSIWSTDLTLVLWVCAIGGGASLLLASDEAVSKELRAINIDALAVPRAEQQSGAMEGYAGYGSSMLADDEAVFRRVYDRAVQRVGIRQAKTIVDVIERISLPRALDGVVKEFVDTGRA